MMRIVRDQITGKRHDVGLEIRHLARWVVQRFLQQAMDGIRTDFQGRLRLRSGHLVWIRLRRMFPGFIRSGKPHEPDIVHVRGNATDGPAFAGKRRRLPGGIGDVAQEQLIGLLVDRECLQ